MDVKQAVLALSVTALAGQAMAQGNAAQNVLMLGAGLSYSAEYDGADKKRAKPLVFFDYQHASGFFASMMRGFGYRHQLDAWQLSAAIGYAPGREDERGGAFSRGSDDLRGMGDIPGSAQLILGAVYDFGALKTGLRFQQPLSQRETGRSLHLNLSGTLYRDQEQQVELEWKTAWGSAEHAQTWYGVTPQQSAASGYRAYRPGSGLEAMELQVNWTRMLSAPWSLRISGGVQHLLGDAASSPLVRNKSNPKFMAAVNYRF
ncbi:MipA/OmpV family protein [Massilia sp. W12]|uniref:MipA/OmpV family protein n=1 Tax=Massilia sp. W12 TaxID=3126507 RepID=UPI0030D1E226